jgi:hypothetical protein
MLEEAFGTKKENDKSTHLLHTSRLATLATNLVCQLVFFCRLFGFTLFELGIKCSWIAQQDDTHGFFSLFLMFLGVEALKAATIVPAIELDTKALAVEFEAACLFTSTSHVLDLVAMRSFNLSWRLGTFPLLLLLRQFFVVLKILGNW